MLVDGARRSDRLRIWRLFIVGRSAVTGVFLALLLIANGFRVDVSLRPLFIVAALQFAANGMYFYLWRRRDLTFMGYFCFVLEIAMITLLVIAFGPGGSLFVLAYLWPVMMGGWLIGPQATLILTLLSSLAFGLLIYMERHGWMLSGDLASESTSLALFLCLPYLAFVSLLIWAVTSELERGQSELAQRNLELHQVNTSLRSLVSASERFLGCVNLQDLLHVAIREVKQITGHSGAAIYVNRNDQLQLAQESRPPSIASDNPEQRQVPSEWLDRSAAAVDVINEPIGLASDRPTGVLGSDELRLQTHVALRSGHGLEGMLSITPSIEEAIGQQDSQILRVLGHILGNAIENATLFDNLGHERNLLSSILERMAEGVLVVDQDGSPLLLNPAMRSLLGIADSQPVPFEFMERALAMLESTGSEYARETIEWQQKTISVSAAKLLQTNDIPNSMIFVARDVTQEAQVQRMKSDFVAYASHELRTPLTTTKMMTRLLMMDADKDSKAYEYLSVIDTQVDRQKRLITNLLDMARLEAGRFDMALDIVDPSQTVRGVAKACQPLAQDKGIRIEVDATGSPETVVSNSVGIEQVLTNLVSNAIKFTETDGDINIRCAQEDGYVLFQVMDHGIGMSEEQLDRIFTKFYTVRNPRKHGEGTGLGLAISDMIIKQLGGSIDVTSKPGQGSCFRVLLPLSAS